ncbi:DUF4214 domain-containing protein, partial [Hominifimenecus microfluidus]|uniref:DUF4214 domain-containing protein n=1 Tax=Hominifimenecus microfluidus TaxID=2885348 RepID=UPI0032BF5535
RINFWYFADEPFHGPDVDVVDGQLVYNTELEPGDTYTLPSEWFGKNAGSSKDGYAYTIYEENFEDWALQKVEPEVLPEAEDIDAITELPYDFSQAAQLPLTGYFTKAISEGRTVKVYIPENASIRSYFTVIAVPDDIDTTEFLEESGWFNIADEEGECLFILEPGADGWGSAADETAYVDAAMSFARGCKNANNVMVFSTFGEFYFAGYGEGAPALERYAAANPILVIAQVYMGSDGLAADALNTLGSAVYEGSKAEGSGRETKDEIYEILGGKLLKRSEVAVPTWLINYGADSKAYWSAANDVLTANYSDDVLGTVYPQDINSDAYATLYANTRRKAAGEQYGLSLVAVKSAEVDYLDPAFTDDLRQYLEDYTRYDVTMAYSNALAERLDYTESLMAAQDAAKDGQVIETLNDVFDIWAFESAIVPETGATMYTGIAAFADNAKDGDGVADPREFMIYVPTSAQVEGHKAPIVFVYAGNSQTDRIFFDCTQWWKIAEEEGVVLAFPCETYSNNSVSVSHADNTGMYQLMLGMIEAHINGQLADIDYSRMYCTGQSAGSAATQTFAQVNPEFFAAVASTSAGSLNAQATGKAIPAYLLHGLGDSNGGYTLFQEENAWRGIFNYYLKADGLGSLADFTAEDTAYSYKFLEGTYIADAGRYSDTYNFAGEDGIPLVRYTRTSLRPHNCYPEESWLMWNFLKHYSFEVSENGIVDRYYSESAFAEEDAVEILENKSAELQAQVESIDTVTIPNFYGQKVGTVTVTFKEGTDMAAVKNAGVTLYDRGSLDAQFGEVKISDVKYDGNKVILTIDQGSEKVTDRSRNAFGIYATMSWYIDSEGNIFYGKEDTTDALGMTIHANKTGKGYQARKNLDLILCVGDTDLTEGLAMTDGVGNLLEGTVWNKVVNEGYDDIKTMMVDVGWKAEGYTMMGDKGEVPVNVIWPEGYDAKRAEKYPVVVYQCGSGLCYWELTDTSVDGVLAPANNPGCNYSFDNMMTGWAEAYPEAIILSVDVHNTSEVVAAKEVAGVLDYFIANYNVDKDKIVGVGNSYGTFVVSDLIRQRPDLVSAFVENNGDLGNHANQAEVNGTLKNSSLKKWTADELKAMIDNQIAVWFINGETDIAHPAVQQDAYTILKREYKAAGMSDEWIDQYLRASGYQSWNFKAWGESDHSCTKITAWYYLQNAYLAPNEDGEVLKPGDTYRLTGKEDAQYYGADKFDYKVYAESISEWAKKAVSRDEEEHLQAQVTDIQYTIVKNFYGYKVGEVTVTFDKDVDATALAAADFVLYDRGSANPYFGEVKIANVKVAGNVVTLTIDQGSDKVTDRSRNTYGALTTTGWYRDTAGNIFFGSEDANDELGIAINPNLTGKSCFPRENLDLILCVNTTEPKNGIASTDGMGNLLKDTVWTKITDESGLSEIKLEMVDPGWKAEGYTIVNEAEKTEGKVPVHVIYPDGYDKNRAEKYPVIFYQAGGGVCYWELTDLNQAGVYAPATNLGDNTVYDVMMTKWHEAVPEAIIMSVNVHSNLTESPREIAGVLDYAIKNWNVDKEKIVGVGNSMGTLIISELLRQRSDLVTAFVECNGNLGGMASADKLDGTLANSSFAKWSEKDVEAFIKNEVAVWMFNGETDGDNPAAQQDIIEIVKNLYRETGKSEEWIDSHVRASGLQSWKFKQWGETDHSVTKVVAWNYIENPYTDVNAGQKPLKAGDIYHFTGVENYNKYQYTMDYEYVVYEESVSKWVRNLFAGTYEKPEYTDVEAFVARLYEYVLGRTPDQKGLDAWVSQLTSGANGGEEVAKGFIFSNEYIRKNTSNDAFVEMLYNTLLDRKSDAAGKKAWVAQLDSGKATREDVVEGFIHSNEFIGICDEFGIFTTAAEAFASRLYTKCLGRKYDKSGLKSWADLLHNHKISGGAAAKGFFLSNEFIKKNYSDEEFVARCYRTFLNREADANGLMAWMLLLKKGQSRESILDGFIGSDEFTKLCAQYGIDR